MGFGDRLVGVLIALIAFAFSGALVILALDPGFVEITPEPPPIVKVFLLFSGGVLVIPGIIALRAAFFSE